MPRRLLTAATIAVALVASAAPAAADPGPPSAWAAAAQYVEMIPTSTGPRPVGAAGATKRLPDSLAARFSRRGGADAKALKTLVTSSGWGASVRARPSPAAKPRDHGASVQMLAVPLPQESAALPESLGNALTGGGRATFALVGLLVLAAAFTLARFLGRRP